MVARVTSHDAARQPPQLARAMRGGPVQSIIAPGGHSLIPELCARPGCDVTRHYAPRAICIELIAALGRPRVLSPLGRDDLSPASRLISHPAHLPLAQRARLSGYARRRRRSDSPPRGG